MSPVRRTANPVHILILVLVGAGIFFSACAACWSFISTLAPEVAQPTPAPAMISDDLRLAYSPEKQALLEDLVSEFNSQQLTTSSGKPMRIELVQMDPETMVDVALAGDVQAILPDSSVWLDVLDRRYAETQVSEDSVSAPESITSGVTRWMVSPVVIAMWEETAREMGWPDKPIGWKDLLERAQSDPSFRWSHPSTSSASGLLATLAQFYAGAGITRGLTVDQASSEAVTSYVSAIQKTVRFYGEGEWAVIQRALSEGKSFLDAFVVQEQLVVYFNQQATRPGHLVAIYPDEGTLWEDHPLALVETPDLRTTHRETYAAFKSFLSSQIVQQRVLEAGYRPADLSIPIDGPASPISATNGVNADEPQTTLQMPAPPVVEIVRDVWWLTKRHTNVYLVVDTSGSMYGSKIARVQEALQTFIEQIEGDRERVGLIAFASYVYRADEMEQLRDNRAQLLAAIGGLQSEGDTALIDAVSEGYSRLQQMGDKERINAIVVMTDGKENASSMSLSRLERQIKQGNSTGVPVVIFCIAYGGDADLYTLERIASASGGQVRTGDLETVRGLYKILSTYF